MLQVLKSWWLMFHVPIKLIFNALANHETLTLVNQLAHNVSTAILVGVETHICIYQTALGLQEHGFTPWIVADGVSSRTEANYQLGLARLTRHRSKQWDQLK